MTLHENGMPELAEWKASSPTRYKIKNKATTSVKWNLWNSFCLESWLSWRIKIIDAINNGRKKGNRFFPWNASNESKPNRS